MQSLYARSLNWRVAGDPAISYTETHQVIPQVGDAKGIETAQRLEENNIIVNQEEKGRIGGESNMVAFTTYL